MRNLGNISQKVKQIKKFYKMTFMICICQCLGEVGSTSRLDFWNQLRFWDLEQ